jgi:hypothetical protein
METKINEAFPLPHLDKALDAFNKATELFPNETWEEVYKNVHLSASRKPKNKNQQGTLNKELLQAKILADLGHTVYLLPEIPDKNSGKKHPDAVMDGIIIEFKNITGSIRQVEEHFKESREKAKSVFFKIDSALSRHEVTRKLAGVIRSKGYSDGRVIVYFTKTTEIFYWNVNDLK